MKRAPLYDDPGARRVLDPAGNLGLWYTRFFDRYDEMTWTLESEDKRRWIEDAAAKDRNHSSLESLIHNYADRRLDMLRQQGGVLREYRAVWHFATGLGLPHPVENGFAWHPTLGMPFLPGSSVKGLLAAWLYTVEHDEDESESSRAEARRRRDHWCGVAEEPGLDSGHAGSLIFFDALPSAPPKLTTDVMTPHMGQWYAEGASIRNVDREPDKVPADWHSPVPVHFLVVSEVVLLFAVAPRPGAIWEGRDPSSEAEAALEELEKALRIFGAGAKTAAGYGRFRRADGYLGMKLRDLETLQKEKRKALARKARLKPFEGFDPPVADILGPNKIEGLATIVLKAMDRGTWSQEDCVRLAEALKGWLQSRDEWVEDARESTLNPKKNKPLLKTLKVLDWLEKGN